MNEIWKDISGYEGLYQVSNQGRVRSLDRTVAGKNGSRCFRKGKILIGVANRKDYLQVSLRKDGVLKTHKIHRLVAETFIPNLEGKPTVDHINRDKTDNCVDNLRWATYSEQRDNVSGANVKKPVVAIKGEIILYFDSTEQAGKFGFFSSNIRKCCKGQRKTHHGFKWLYLEEYQRMLNNKERDKLKKEGISMLKGMSGRRVHGDI